MGKHKVFDEYPLRTCRYMDSCVLCLDKISSGQQYYDGGYGRRAHRECVEFNKRQEAGNAVNGNQRT